MRDTMMEVLFGVAVGSVMAMALISAPGCQRMLNPDTCSDAAFRRLDEGCKRAIDQAQSPEEVDAIVTACKLWIDEQTEKCQ